MQTAQKAPTAQKYFEHQDMKQKEPPQKWCQISAQNLPKFLTDQWDSNKFYMKPKNSQTIIRRSRGIKFTFRKLS